jgi:hypothetical protein
MPTIAELAFNVRQIVRQWMRPLQVFQYCIPLVPRPMRPAQHGTSDAVFRHRISPDTTSFRHALRSQLACQTSNRDQQRGDTAQQWLGDIGTNVITLERPRGSASLFGAAAPAMRARGSWRRDRLLQLSASHDALRASRDGLALEAHALVILNEIEVRSAAESGYRHGWTYLGCVRHPARHAQTGSFADLSTALCSRPPIAYLIADIGCTRVTGGL